MLSEKWAKKRKRSTKNINKETRKKEFFFSFWERGILPVSSHSLHGCSKKKLACTNSSMKVISKHGSRRGQKRSMQEDYKSYCGSLELAY